jgi:hypothetical protein
MDLDREALISFRDQLRDARASALLNTESFQELLFVVERFGFLLTKNPKATGLGDYKDAVETFAVKHSALATEIMRAWHTHSAIFIFLSAKQETMLCIKEHLHVI